MVTYNRLVEDFIFHFLLVAKTAAVNMTVLWHTLRGTLKSRGCPTHCLLQNII